MRSDHDTTRHRARPCSPALAFLLLFALTWLMSTADHAYAASRTYGPIHIESHQPLHATTAGGYAEYRFFIYNRDAERDRHVRLQMPTSSYGHGHYIRQMQRSARVPANGRIEISMWQPPLSINGHGVRVFIDGQRQRETLGLSMSDHGQSGSYRWTHTNPAAVLVDRSVDADIREHLANLLESTSTGHRNNWTFARADRQINRWSDTWLSYSRFNGVLIEADRLAAAPAPVREAIWSYVRLGGTLLLIDDTDGADDAHALVPERWRQNIQTERTSDDDAFTTYTVGFGRCWAMPGAMLRGWDRADQRQLRTFFEHGAMPWSQQHSIQEANANFPVIENLGVPVRGLLALMIVFAITIGPLNVLLLARWNRRMWTLWTVPAIAVLFSAAVFGYATFAEGWRAQSRIAGLTLLEEGQRRASTLGWAGFYAPITPRDGLRYDRHTELNPQLRVDRWSNEGQPRFIDWTDGQHLTAGWVQARIPSHLRIRRSQMRRERLRFDVESNDEVRVTNGLGADIRLLYVRNDAGELYEARNIRAGATAALAPAPRDGVEPQMGLDALYARDWVDAIERLTQPRNDVAEIAVRRRVEPNTYLAVVEGSPFIEPGLADAQQRESESVVFGIMADPLTINVEQASVNP